MKTAAEWTKEARQEGYIFSFAKDASDNEEFIKRIQYQVLTDAMNEMKTSGDKDVGF